MDKENSISQKSRHERPPISCQEDRPEYISLSPSKELTFEFEKNKFVAQLTISNLLIRPVSFKALIACKLSLTKISLGQMYPANGELLPREQKILKIVMLPNYEYTERYKDRFLIQAFPSNKNSVVDSARESMRSLESSQKELFRAQNIKLNVRFVFPESQNQIEWDQTSSWRTRELLKGKYSMHTPSTDDSLMNKNDISQLNALRFLPKRSKLVLSPDGHDKDIEKEQTQKNFSQYSKGEHTRQMDAKEKVNETKSGINNDSSQIMMLESVLSQDSKADSYKSFIDLSELDSGLKMKVLKLKEQYQMQKIMLEKIQKERDSYIEEINKIRFIFFNDVLKDTVPTLKQSKLHKKPLRFKLWQLLLISIIFLILGSLIS